MEDKEQKFAKFIGLEILEADELIVPNIYKTIEDIPQYQFLTNLDWLFTVIKVLYNVGYSVEILDGVVTLCETKDMRSPLSWIHIPDNKLSHKQIKLALFDICNTAIDHYYAKTKKEYGGN